MAGGSPALHRDLHAQTRQLAQHRRDLLLDPDPPHAAPRRFHLPPRPCRQDPQVHRGLQPDRQALPLVLRRQAPQGGVNPPKDHCGAALASEPAMAPRVPPGLRGWWRYSRLVGWRVTVLVAAVIVSALGVGGVLPGGEGWLDGSRHRRRRPAARHARARRRPGRARPPVRLLVSGPAVAAAQRCSSTPRTQTDATRALPPTIGGPRGAGRTVGT